MTEVYKSSGTPSEDVMERLKKYELKEQRMKESVRKFYNKKIHTDAEFYKTEKLRVAEYIRNRYNTDEEFREKRNQKRRDNYAKKKEEKKKILEGQ